MILKHNDVIGNVIVLMMKIENDDAKRTTKDGRHKKLIIQAKKKK